MTQMIEGLLLWVLDNLDPWLMLLYALSIGIILWLSTYKGSAKEDDKGIVISLTYLKNTAIRLIALVLVMMPVGIILLAWSAGLMPKYWHALLHEMSRFISDLWYSALLVMALPLAMKFWYLRYLKPKISAWYRRYRISQTGESLSDVRTVLDTYKAKDFEPKSYYKDDYFFLGLDENNEPVYVEEKDFNSAHLRIVGPTQCGKGVGLGVLIDQAIRKQYCVGFLDVKPDDFIYDIMRETCEEIGRDEPIVVDLNGYGIGRFAPFANGSKRDRRERVMTAMDLNDDGSNADFYRTKARDVYDFIEPYWDGSIVNLHELLHGKGGLSNISEDKKAWIFENSENLRSRLSEWKNHEPFNPKAGRGFNLERSIENNQVMYIRSHAKDKLVRKASAVLVEELTQIGLKRGKGKNQVFWVFDEVRFVISETLADALATLLSKGINMALAYQSINDLLSLPDKRMNANSIKAGVETNTRRSIFYTASDNDTAEWVSKYSGTVMKSVARSENVRVNEAGGEEWDDSRMLHKTEEGFVHENVVKNLPARVGVLFQPNSIATMLHTCWIPVKEFKGIPLKENMPQKAPKTTETKVENEIQKSDNEKVFPNRKSTANEVADASISAKTKPKKENTENVDALFGEIWNEGSEQKESKPTKTSKDNEISDLSDMDGI